jgi:hypothetical protein
VYVERSANSNIAYLRGLPLLAGNFTRSRQKSAHKDGLAIRVYDLFFTCAESGVRPSDCRGVSGIQCDFCERHRICWESCDPISIRYNIITNYHKDAEPQTSAITIPILNYHSVSSGLSG